MCLKRVFGFFKERKSESIHFAALVVLGVLSFSLYTNLDCHNLLKYFAAAYLTVTLAFPVLIGSLPGLLITYIIAFLFSINIFTPGNYWIYQFTLGVPIALLWLFELWCVSGVFASKRKKESKAKERMAVAMLVAGVLVGLLVVLAYLGAFNVGGKPAVYLYPEKDMFVNVTVHPQGFIIKSDPAYGGGWQVYARQGGLIDDKYDYLYYEVLLIDFIEKPESGWVVRYRDLDGWFDEKLPELGLNEAETEEFKEYWLAMLPESDYYQMGLLSEKFLEKDMRLVVEPEPDTEIRLIFYFKPLKERIELPEPETSKKERIGFTVVEWGGVIDSSTALSSPGMIR